MEATIVPKVQKHYPVLLKEIISIITPQYGGTFIDCTFGQGGYSKKILEFENTKVIALDRDIEIAVFDGLRGTGNNLCLPAGPLRESLNRVKDVDFIVSSSQSLQDSTIKEDYVMEYKPVKWIRISDNESFEPNNWPLSRAVHAVAGIGNPSKFYNLIRNLGLQPIEHSFPDHYQFNEEDLSFNDQLPIIMTEKDSIRCRDINLKNIWYLKVEAKLLKAIDFPPLKRVLKDFTSSKTVFYGFYIEEHLSGVIEISCHHEFTHINSLVVDPNFFRQGIAKRLMKFVFDKFILF